MTPKTITIATILQWFEQRGNSIQIGDSLNAAQLVTRPKAIDEATEDHVSFLNQKYENTYVELLKKTNCRCILVPVEWSVKELTKSYKQTAFVYSKNPKQDLHDLMKALYATDNAVEETVIHPTAIVSQQAVIGKQVHVAAHVVIEGNVLIGDGCNIGSGTVIKTNTSIGKNVIIGANNVLGGDGFGYLRNEETGEYELFPHLGGVVIRDNVHIGNNTCIDRGSLKDTVIKRGAKIDNLVHIAHNVHVGENSLIIACTMIAGSVVIGNNCWVAPCSAVRNGIEIGDNSTIGMGSVVTKSVAKNQVVTGSPAVPLEEFVRLRKFQLKQLDQSTKHD